MHEFKSFQTQDALAPPSGAGGLITWLFEEDSFSPIAKIKNDKHYSIVNDHLGTPYESYDDKGDLVWSRELNSNGKTIKETGIANFCPFLYQGQSFDKEIKLAYNRFRYYDVEDGRYISPDPIGLKSGELNFYSYVTDSNNELDVLGLAKSSYTILSGPLHHIATNKNTKRGKKWTNRFKPFFDNAGLDMDGADNKVYVPDHKGPHPDAYHQHVFDKLSEATDGIDPVKNKQEYQNGVKDALSNIASDAQTSGTSVNNWLIKI